MSGCPHLHGWPPSDNTGWPLSLPITDGQGSSQGATGCGDTRHHGPQLSALCLLGADCHRPRLCLHAYLPPALLSGECVIIITTIFTCVPAFLLSFIRWVSSSSPPSSPVCLPSSSAFIRWVSSSSPPSSPACACSSSSLLSGECHHHHHHLHLCACLPSSSECLLCVPVFLLSFRWVSSSSPPSSPACLSPPSSPVCLPPLFYQVSVIITITLWVSSSSPPSSPVCLHHHHHHLVRACLHIITTIFTCVPVLPPLFYQVSVIIITTIFTCVPVLYVYLFVCACSFIRWVSSSSPPLSPPFVFMPVFLLFCQVSVIIITIFTSSCLFIYPSVFITTILFVFMPVRCAHVYLFLCVHMCVFVFVCAHVCMHICIFVYACMCLCTCVCFCVYTLYVYLFVCAHCMCICVCAHCMCICVCVHIVCVFVCVCTLYVYLFVCTLYVYLFVCAHCMCICLCVHIVCVFVCVCTLYVYLFVCAHCMCICLCVHIVCVFVCVCTLYVYLFSYMCALLTAHVYFVCVCA